jgi:hypothetical protein
MIVGGKGGQRMDARSNPVLLCNRLLRVDIDFRKCNAFGGRMLFGESIVGGTYSFARATPICVNFRRLAVAYESGMRRIQSVTTILLELRVLLNSADDPMLIGEDILSNCAAISK